MCTAENKNDGYVEQAKIQRVLNLIMTLYKGAYRPNQIAELFDCSERTAYRYIRLIESIGISVDSDLDSHYFIAQDNCPVCKALIKDSGDIANPAVTPELST